MGEEVVVGVSPSVDHDCAGLEGKAAGHLDVGRLPVGDDGVGGRASGKAPRDDARWRRPGRIAGSGNLQVRKLSLAGFEPMADLPKGVSTAHLAEEHGHELSPEGPPPARLSAFVSRTNRSNSVRGKSWRIWLNMLENRVMLGLLFGRGRDVLRTSIPTTIPKEAQLSKPNLDKPVCQSALNPGDLRGKAPQFPSGNPGRIPVYNGAFCRPEGGGSPCGTPIPLIS